MDILLQKTYKKSIVLRGKDSFKGFAVSLIVLFFIFSAPEVRAQQDFINGFYMFNPVSFNPAIAGVNDQIVLSGIVREQWSGLNGAPKTQYFNAHMPVFSWLERYGRSRQMSYPTGFSSGVLVLNDKIGATNYTRFSVPMAVRIRVSQSGIRLSGGVRVDASRFSIDIGDLRQDGGDFFVNEPRYFVDFAAGLYVYHTRWYFGLSMTNMRALDIFEYGYKFEPHYFMTAGYAFPINRDLAFRITNLTTAVLGSTISITLTPALIIKDKIETGLTYRYDDMVGAFFSFKPSQNLKIGYWYEYPTGIKINQLGATHELVFQLTFERFKRRGRSARYFW
jgi:type IX secretion system PorP/SprF family membrane protein